MKRLLIPLLAALALPTAVSSYETKSQISNARIEGLTSGSISTICGANELNYISDKNTESMLEIIYNSHMKTYKGSKEEANDSYRKIYSENLEYYPECNSRAFKLKRD